MSTAVLESEPLAEECQVDLLDQVMGRKAKRPYEIIDAALWLTHDNGPMPYLANTVRLFMQYVQSRDVQIMACDKHWRVYYNPEATIHKMSLPQCGAIVAHEAMHLLLKHAERREMFLPMPTKDVLHRWNTATDLSEEEVAAKTSLRENLVRWNLACDFAGDSLLREVPVSVNGERDQNLFSIQGDFCPAPDKHGLDLPWGKTAEWYWGHLPSNEELKKKLPGVFENPMFGSGAADGVMHVYELAEDSEECHGLVGKRKLAAEYSAAEKVVEYHKKYGKVPGGLIRWADAIVTRKLPWDKLWAGVCSQAGEGLSLSQEHSWTRVSRRSSPYQDMPTRTTASPRIGLGIDTSGSVGSQEIGQALSIATDIFSRKGGKLKVYTGDTDVHWAKKCSRASEIEFHGGGGTDMARVLKVMSESKPKHDVLVLITDAYTPWPTEPLGVKVIACITANGTMDNIPPWVRAVKIEPVGE